LPEYLENVWSALWISMIMFAVLWVIGLFMENFKMTITLIVQMLSGAVLYVTIFMYSQQTFVHELKEMLWSGKR
jgi:hypothetical protein